MYDYAVARVKEQKFHWLEQKLTITDLAPSNYPSHASDLRPIWEMERDLWRLGLNVWNHTPFGHLDRPSQRKRIPLQGCDSCYLSYVVGRVKNVYGVCINCH